MPGQRIRWDYDQLIQIAKQFSHEADATRQTITALKRQMEVLEGGDWIGTGARAFYAEMNSAVLPAFERLARAMDEAARTTLAISEIGKGTEEATARILSRLAAARALNLDSAGGGGAQGGGSGGGFLSGVGDFFEGMWEEGKGMVSGLVHMAIHPIDTLEGLAYGVTHPAALWDALTKPYKDDWNNGHPWRAIGRGVLFAASMLVGAHGADKVGKVAEAAEVADVARAAEVADVARAAEIADVAKAAEVADAAKAAEVADAARAGEVADVAKGADAAGAGEAAARARLAETLRLRARSLELGTDPARGFIESEGIGGPRIEQALGRTITRSADEAADFVDKVLGPVSLKGPIPAAGSVEGLAAAAIKDAQFNTATKALFVDTKGLSPAQITHLKTLIADGTVGLPKKIFILE